MSFGALLFFFLFVATLVFSYIALRRRLASPRLIGAGCIFGAILSMILFGLAQGAIFLQAFIVGILIGAGFGIATLVVALYFQGNEMRKSGG
jgi:ABC-type enterobactin transport system permease subunit